MDIKTLNKMKIKMIMYDVYEIATFLEDLKNEGEKEISSCVIYKSKNSEDFEIKLNHTKEFEHFIDSFEEEISLNIKSIIKYLNFDEYKGELLVGNLYNISKFIIKRKGESFEFHFRLEDSIQDILLNDKIDPIIDSIIKLLDKMEVKLSELFSCYENIKLIESNLV